MLFRQGNPSNNYKKLHRRIKQDYKAGRLRLLAWPGSLGIFKAVLTTPQKGRGEQSKGILPVFQVSTNKEVINLER